MSSSKHLPQALGEYRAEQRMRIALEQALLTPPGDIPVGAVIFSPSGEIIGRGVNRREADQDPLGHAEIMAIRQAAPRLGDSWRLSDCELVVTLEPCTMCAGAAVGARMGSIIFGAYEPKTGACGSLFDVVRDQSLLHRPQVRAGVLEDECSRLLSGFFTSLRNCEHADELGK
ncbi:tRNA-specific adenosine deaminase [Corynebacterium kutscheri]|uniref:nucleoside deaminase n=1 Tax=Corynebacterium kutscheri TaxID=35755 RepID=UPI000F6B57AE|nr:nucleoside deaminase [Corynebacterium kutscheri]VEH80770.1 tRNA-specific adenosine deaminase [Corynebacterium kutscheri]